MILAAQEGGLRTLTINRPDKAGALTPEMLQSLSDKVTQATEEGAAALILTGTGRVFSAGADLDAARAGLATSPLWEELSGRIAAFPGLTIAALNGTVAGGAMGMVLACDLRIAVPTAKVFYPVMQLGFLPQPSDPKRLAALIGPARAKMILMAAQKIPATEAHQWGLFDRLSEDPMAQARDMAAPCLAAAPEHLQAIKSLCR
ncbi:enoyl-CoA hydratase/isomerase family protein [Alphaproteobacteria bacterium KMM 3653]|uniref:Enoyl-CoA hydratase/isomerase family protein n=1 Tax=Harenicola maris TaxID=2841044 RepID=A0AAP2G8E6_9RHOB|nr:enoyl-CoA hydratase/isomerase family protein [Harenicola maris]